MLDFKVVAPYYARFTINLRVILGKYIMMRIDLMIQIRKYLLMLLFLFANSCSYLVSSATDDFGSHLKHVILNHNDPQLVVEAIPSYILLQESLIVADPDNEALRMNTATLYSSYITLTDKLDDKRKQGLSQKAFDHALHGACLHKQAFCKLNEKQYDKFTKIIDQSDLNDLDSLYGVGVSWANWIQAHRSDWNAVAQLAQVKYIMNYVVTTNEDYKKGEPYLYSAVMECIVPPSLGGKPELAKSNFEKALQLSNNKNLMMKVLYAKHYARMMFDRDLHNSLLNTVISAQLDQTGLTLSNTLAQQQAKKLLQSADAYF